MKIILVVGLPGSGKSHLIDQYQHMGFWSIDDFNIDKLSNLCCAIKNANNIIISDVNFCSTDTLNRAITFIESLLYLADRGSQCIIEIMYFENAPDKCRKNVQLRQSKGDLREVEGTIRRFEKIYKIPEAYEPIRIWQNEV